MSQPPFQPPPLPPQPPQQPPQPPQAPQSSYNPYSQPGPPQQPPQQQLPQQQPAFGPPPVPGQPPMQPMQHATPYPAAPFGQGQSGTGNAGNAFGAILLGFVVSFVISLVYVGINLATYKEQSTTVSNALYLLHALLNGAAVGALAGTVGRGSNGARVGAAIIAVLGTFFGYTNTVVSLFLKDGSLMPLRYMLEDNPLYPAKAWWDTQGGGVDWFSLLGLPLAAAAAWGLAYLIGNKGRTA
ncbi:hypothetical protein [Streptomyces sp. NPDC046862]|uniref:hypothetical protein n=1 Tax=Streptomyces sp. NPDC046862 TaxID=3154603 RepID=UPI0034569AC8